MLRKFSSIFDSFRKHRCPHRPYGIIGKGDQPCAVTEYRSEFIPREPGARESFKPEYKYQSSGNRLDDETTHKYFSEKDRERERRKTTSSVPFRHDYIAHSLDKQRSYKPEEVYVPRGEFDALTSYNKEYTRKTKDFN